MSRIEAFFQRINRAATEIGTEHFDDDKDWDERVKLPAWQTARLRERYEKKKAKRFAETQQQASNNNDTSLD